MHVLTQTELTQKWVHTRKKNTVIRAMISSVNYKWLTFKKNCIQKSSPNISAMPIKSREQCPGMAVLE